MSIQEILPLAMQASLFLLVLSFGLESRWSDVVYMLRRPAQLLRAILAVNVIVPGVAIALCLMLSLPPWTQAGLAIMSVSPFAPFAPIKMLKSQAERGYVIGTYVALMLAAILIVPATAMLLRPLAPYGGRLPVPVVAMFVGETVLLPLFVGIALHRQWEVFSERVAPLARKAAFAILLPAALLILVRFSADFLALVGDGTLFVIALTVAAGLVSGYVLGGPDPANRRALGDAAATRHPGLAAAIAQLNSNESRVLAAIVLYLFSSILFSIGYAWIASRFKSRPLRKAHASHP